MPAGNCSSSQLSWRTYLSARGKTDKKRHSGKHASMLYRSGTLNEDTLGEREVHAERHRFYNACLSYPRVGHERLYKCLGQHYVFVIPNETGPPANQAQVWKHLICKGTPPFCT